MISQREENMIYGYRNKVKKSFRFLLYFRILKMYKTKKHVFFNKYINFFSFLID